MLLYIVRHAFAGQHGDPSYPDDSLRPLTKKGRKQFRRVVKKLCQARLRARSSWPRVPWSAAGKRPT